MRTNQRRTDLRAKFFDLIYATQPLTWLLLTKRIGNVPNMLVGPGMPGRMPSNVWLGATLANREEMLRDGPKLKAVSATVRFWSVEPMLGPLGEIPRELRAQCDAAGVPFFFKQWGGRNADAGGCELDGAEVKAWPTAA